MNNIKEESLNFYNNWKEEFIKRKEEIINTISNTSEITITIENSQTKDSIELKKDKSYIPSLIKIENNKIITKYISKEFIELILNNLSENIEIINVPGEFVQYPEVLGLYPKLRDIRITNYYELNSNEVMGIKEYTNINSIESFNFKKLIEKYELNALYYDGKIQEIKLLNGDLTITNPNKRYNIICHNFIIPSIYNNIDAVIKYMIENDIDSKELQYFNAISTTTNEDYISCNNDDDAIEYYGDLEELKNMIEKMKSLNFYPSYIILKLENKDYDYRLLKGIKYPILIDYGERYTATIEEFIAMRETINYFKNLITSQNLSPLEQVTYAYDIIKSFEYKEGQSPEDSRTLHNIVRSGNIVCVGYALFLKQVLRELGFKIEDYSVNAKNEYNQYGKNNNHRRNIIRIDDDKYDIHMIAACDPTWDSYSVENNNNRFTNENSAMLGNATNLLSYIHFLVPKKEYEYVFNDKETPSMFKYPPELISKNFDYLPKYSTANENFDDAMIYYQSLFEKGESELIKQYIDADRPSYEVFKEILKNVKLAEGYGKYTDKIVNSIDYETDYTKKVR